MLGQVLMVAQHVILTSMCLLPVTWCVFILMLSHVKHGLSQAAIHCCLAAQSTLHIEKTAALTASLQAATEAFASCVLNLCKPQVCLVRHSLNTSCNMPCLYPI